MPVEQNNPNPLDAPGEPAAASASRGDNDKNRNLSQQAQALGSQPTHQAPPDSANADSDAGVEPGEAPAVIPNQDAVVGKNSGAGPIHSAITTLLLLAALGQGWYGWHLTQSYKTVLVQLMTIENQLAVSRETPESISRQLVALTVESHELAQKLAAQDQTIAALTATVTPSQTLEATTTATGSPADVQAGRSAVAAPAMAEAGPTTPLPAAHTGVAPVNAAGASDANAATGRWLVNLAILSRETSARQLVRKLSGHGGEPEIRAIQSGGTTRYQVRMVGFSTREAAELAAQRAQRVPGLSGVTVSRN